MKWWVATVLPRALRFKRPLHRCNACNPETLRRTESNHHGQVCVVLVEHRFAPQRQSWSQPMVTLHPNLAYDAWSLA